ncbi:MAG: hypothetical protein KJ904_08500 [Alphaproteobacteria bacterium]|nr:hypothetical protein [Alphaproteobacteria bacterium]MBU0796192.1 hypothetical protein [Alphaproteobacteria bacterium]MBU0887192.1 hypothetical protein [Alphaproteobacteria bacterium]MBU1812280.1 hypothetical protein [Alphaproteobacteria bacterium]MBU2089582.1 hypothetical protein [Alphaproteobacteria bacterium]
MRDQDTHTQPQQEDYCTIIASSMAEAMHQFAARGLAREGYSIAGRAGRHALLLVDGEGATELFPGEKMFAATFVRRRAPATA